MRDPRQTGAMHNMQLRPEEQTATSCGQHTRVLHLIAQSGPSDGVNVLALCSSACRASGVSRDWYGLASLC